MSSRRFDLDWLRVIAFGLLILYHIGMFYVTWGWHVKSSHQGSLLEPIMLMVNPWRMSLLFLISGVATRFLLDKMTVAGFLGQRLWRLLPPLLFGMFVIVVPQAYYEVLSAVRASGGNESAALSDFYLRYVTASGNWCDADGCLITPTWNHLWYLAYIILYSIILAPFAGLLKKLPKRLNDLIRGPLVFIMPWMGLWLARHFLYPVFNPTMAVVDDWYLHVVHGGMFFLGYAIAKHQPFFERAGRIWRIMTVLALACWAVLMWMDNHLTGPTSEWSVLVGHAIREAQAWSAILAVIGAAYTYLRHADGPWRKRLNEWVFPFYIIHQTAIIVTGFYLADLGLPFILEATLLICGTLASCVLFYALMRRAGPLRLLAGLKWGG